MITLITGEFGSGKTTAIAEAVRADVAAGRRAYLLVPEQQTVLTEAYMADLLPPSAPLYFEVTNFSRLSNTVFRRVGGLSYKYADAGTRTLLMWRTMAELLPLLHEPPDKGVPELGRVRKMTAAMGELSALGLSAAALERAAGQLPEGGHLRDKLNDLALLSTLYHALLRERYNDTGDDLTRLGDLLLSAGEDLLEGAHVYADGFISCTEQEYRILRGICRFSDLTFTLTLPEGCEEQLCYSETRETAMRLARMAEEAGVGFVRRDCGENRRAASPRLRAVLQQLFADGAEQTESVCRVLPDDGSLSLVSASDAFAAAEYIASDIARRVQEEGARYRDFAVVARHAENYAGLLDVAFENAAIPCFLSKKTDVGVYPAVKLMYTAYAVCTGGWRQSDVISYLKCGLSGVSPEDIDIFEQYTSRWKLSGRRITDEEPWTMHPDGYTPELTARDAQILRRAEEVRQRVLEQLLPLSESCARRPIRRHAESLYDFLTALGVEDQLLSRAEAARMLQKEAEANELSRLFGKICEALDRLTEALPDMETDGETFAELLRLVLGETDMAHIPTALDQVTVGSADLLRIGEVRHIYLIGVNEGEFPAPAEESGLFSESDRRILGALGLPVKPDVVRRSARELFCFARAFAASQASVTVLCAENALGGGALLPAPVFLRLSGLTGQEAIRTRELPPEKRFYRPGTALDYLGILSGSPAGRALARCFAERPEGARALEGLRIPLVDAVCRLRPETVRRLYGKGISLTQARMDQYRRCPFAYFCRYVLRLDPARRIEFGYADVGNLLHAVLERVFSSLSCGKTDWHALPMEQMRERTARILDEYITKVCPASQQRTPRLLHQISQLRRAADLLVGELCEEFSQSEFTPALFELDLASPDPEAPGAPTFLLPDGTPVRLYGRIDRVDTWQNEGRTYLRVIDYKSGETKFSLDDIARGLHLQLLVYLFALWHPENPAFRERIAGTGEILPAGVLYTGARVPEKLYDAPQTSETVLADAHRSVYRSGLLLADETVLRAMDRDLSGRYLPVRLRADGSFYKASEKSLSTLERLGSLLGSLETAVCRLAGGLRAGDGTARPLSEGGNRHVCRYCDMKAVCRSARLE